PFARDLNRLYDAFFGSGAESERFSPAMDLVEGDDHFLVKVDLPGLGEEDVTIEVQERTLTISGQRRSEHEEKGEGSYRVERSFGRFTRSVSLPEGVDPGAIAASFDRGVLEVRVPKPEERKPHRIEVEVTGGRPQPATVEGTAAEPAGDATPPGSVT
ncbi:MAG: Hsp20/alpha crystallin family protein, partial [Gaiellaceae bacterium]